MTVATHTAWRFTVEGTCLYVAGIAATGDLFHYTTDESKAARMTESQCRRFCAYMKMCDTVGFWA